MLVRRRHAGAGLLELLVAIVVTSVGLLGLLATQGMAMRQARLTQFRAVAMQLAQDITERMRANDAFGSALASYKVDKSFADQATLPGAPAKPCDDPAAPCTQAEIALLDMYQWRQAVQGLLPEGAVRLVPGTGASERLADLWIAWRDPSLVDSEGLARDGKECPSGLNVASDNTVRCLFLRIGS